MKKAFKFLCGAASMAAVAFGAYCVYKNVVAKQEDDDFDDFEDCFEDETPETTVENREYVSINITEEVTDTAEEAAEETSDAVEEVADAAEEAAEDLADAAKDVVKEITK